MPLAPYRRSPPLVTRASLYRLYWINDRKALSLRSFWWREHVYIFFWKSNVPRHLYLKLINCQQKFKYVKKFAPPVHARAGRLHCYFFAALFFSTSSSSRLRLVMGPSLALCLIDSSCVWRISRPLKLRYLGQKQMHRPAGRSRTCLWQRQHSAFIFK